MRILVTGATGFIGKRLVMRLLDKGHDVFCLVRKTSKTDFLKEKEAHLSYADITDAGEVEKVFSEVQPEAVFHCAAGVMDKNEEKLYAVNASGTRNICNSCYKHGVRRLVYLSSVAVIAGNPQVPLTDDLPYKATNLYGRSKVEAERIVMDSRRKGLRIAIIRPCIVYGEQEPHAFDRLMKSVASRRIPLPDIPQVEGRLQLAYVDNVAQALELALEKEEALEGTFIIADREVITLRKFLEILYDEAGAGYPPIVPGWISKLGMMVPPVRKKVNRFFRERVYDISRARGLLGYDPGVSTEEGLRLSVRYWRKTKEAEGKARDVKD